MKQQIDNIGGGTLKLFGFCGKVVCVGLMIYFIVGLVLSPLAVFKILMPTLF